MEVLQGKRIALAGFSPETASDLTRKFDSALAFCRAIEIESAGPNSSILINFDLLVLTAHASKPWFEVTGRATDIPLLVVGSALDLAAELAALGRRGRDFLLEGPSSDELLLRAAVLLVESASRRMTGARRAPLVVAADDELSITALVKAVLGSDGINCETATNGGDALALARKLRPDVLVLDVNMPQMGGFEVLSAIKLDPATARMRVILLTGAEQESDLMRGFSLGAADYVVKPFNPMELLVRIRRFVRN